MDVVVRFLEIIVTSKFLVAAIIPTLAFVLLIAVLALPMLPKETIRALFGDVKSRLPAGLVLSLFTVIIAFSLSAFNTFFLKIFEGYILLPHFPWLRRAQKRAARRLMRKREILKRRIIRLEKIEAERMSRPDAAQSETGAVNRRKQAYLSQLKDREYALAAASDSTYSPSLEGILPTQFGNILKAAESYPATRYGIDAVPLWNRLIHVIPDSYYDKIEGTRNELSFLVNCSLLAALFALVSLVFASLNLIQPQTLGKLSQSQLITVYLLAFGVSVVLSAVFYQAAMVVVSSFGSMIRSAYDLFRFAMLEQLHQKLPEDSDAERDLWEKLSEQMAYYNGENPLYFEYKHEKEEETKPQTMLVKLVGSGSRRRGRL